MDNQIANYNIRNSGIELLKIIAIILIVFSHAMPFYSENTVGFMNLNLATNDIQGILILLMRYGGSLGNALFIVCSSWFLVESRNINKRKIWFMICDAFLISIAFLIILLLAGYSVSGSDILKQILPVTFRTNWFICCYICFYMLHPAINIVIAKMEKRKHLQLVVILLIIYGILTYINSDAFYYTQLIGFILLYLIVAYVKLYLSNFSTNLKANYRVFLVSALLYMSLVLIFNFLGLYVGFFSDKAAHWQGFNNPLVIMMSVSLFNIFKEHNFASKIINYIAGLSLLIYLIHENYLLANYVRADVYAHIYLTYTYDFKALWVFAIGCIMLLFGFVGGYYTANLFKSMFIRLERRYFK